MSVPAPQTNPKLVGKIVMDSEEPEQFLIHRVPTHYRIQYFDRRWHRVYSRGFGRAYIVFVGQELLLDDETMKKLSAIVPPWPAVSREQEMQQPDRAPEEKEGMVRGYELRHGNPSYPVDDDDIPF